MRFVFASLFVLGSPFCADAEVKVGSKAFTEGFLLAELAAQKIEAKTGEKVIREFGLGNTGITFAALKKGEIDVYPEYTGTVQEAILKDASAPGFESLGSRLKAMGLIASRPLGFSNTYALAVRRDFAEENKLKKISDLRLVKDRIHAAFSHEFATRADGLNALLNKYGLNFPVDHESLEHSLAYQAIAAGRADLIDVYSTDSQIAKLDLVVLEDDLRFFPPYEAIFLARGDFAKRDPEAWAALNSLGGTVDETAMRNLNLRVEVEKRSVDKVISEHLNGPAAQGEKSKAALAVQIWRRTKEHLFLVGITVLLASLTGVPLGILAARRPRAGQALLLASSIVQTIPSLALLCLLIPLFGIGLRPALVALYLYGLLPIILNTYIGLRSTDAALLETARALGLNSPQRIFWIELPLASRSILGGIKTATIIGIGTATLAALIGAGGYGAPIVSGLAMNDMGTVLMGAIPAAIMSLLAHFAFEGVSRMVVSKGLRL